MPATVIVGLLSLLCAVVLYSVGSWRAFAKRGFDPATVVMLWLAVVFDVAATASMAATIGGLDFSASGWLHTVLALAVMAGMIACAAVGTYAFANGREALARTTSRVILVPWALWVAVFVWGMLTRMPRR